jgi:hypothetical protein
MPSPRWSSGLLRGARARGLSLIALSGGVFQNLLLLGAPSTVSSNTGSGARHSHARRTTAGSVGQAVVAAARAPRGTATGDQERRNRRAIGGAVGFIFGYSLGVQAGPEGLEKLQKAWQDVSNSEEFKGLVATGTAFLENMLTQARETIAGQIGEVSAQDGGLQQTLQKLSSDGDLLDAWNRISSSDPIRGLVANGIALVSGALEHGATVLAERKDGHNA